jgi:hypothetical protein
MIANSYLCRLAAVFTLLAGGVLLHSTGHAIEPPKEVQPKVVKLADLIAAIKEQKGKVVIVDLWNDG